MKINIYKISLLLLIYGLNNNFNSGIIKFFQSLSYQIKKINLPLNNNLIKPENISNKEHINYKNLNLDFLNIYSLNFPLFVNFHSFRENNIFCRENDYFYISIDDEDLILNASLFIRFNKCDKNILGMEFYINSKNFDKINIYNVLCNYIHTILENIEEGKIINFDHLKFSNLKIYKEENDKKKRIIIKFHVSLDQNQNGLFNYNDFIKIKLYSEVKQFREKNNI